MANFFAELKRRHVYRVAAAYVVVAWLILQIINNVAPGLNLPNSAVTLVIVLLAAGFPIALIFAWIFDLQMTDPADSYAPKAKATRLDFALMAALMAVIGIFLYQQFVPLTPRAAQQTAGASLVAPARTGISIAVLPFANLSSDAEQEFFSDGMTEEITSALAKVPGLIVIGRTSAFEFKGQNKDLRMIGQALGTTHLIEGSVRKAGTRVRITAQLIIADSGAHLWTENYDRELTDIFAVQEDIAEAIARALRVPLGLQQGESLVRDRTTDLASYDQYLRAKALYRARKLREAIKLLEPVVARDPGFAPAWALLAQVYVVAQNFSPEVSSGSLEEARRFVQSTQGKAEMAAREAIRLDPRNAIGHAVLARVQGFHREWAAGDDLYKQALALDPNDPDVLLNYAVTIAVEGRLKDALSVMEKLRTLEPFVPISNALNGHFFVLNGQSQTAIPILEAISADAGGGVLRNVWLAQAYAAVGRYGAAADTVLLITASQVSRRSVEDAARLLRSAPATVGAPQALPALGRDLDIAYAYVGAQERMLESYERGNDIGVSLNDTVWLPELAPLRKTERFKALMRAIGLTDYWRERGWPDLCRPTGADDFVCD